MKSCIRKIHWRREGLPTPVFSGFPCSSAGKESACNVGYLTSICRLGRSPGEGKGYPLQYSGLENSMDCIVHAVTKSWTGLSNFHVHGSAGDAGDPGLIPVSGRSPGEGNGNPLQYSCLEHPMDRGAGWATVHGVTKSWT